MSISSWLRRRRLDEEDFREEIAAHLAMAAAEKIADGADPESARLDSRKDFGNLALTTEAARRVWTPWWIDAIHDQISDVRYAIRALAKNPLFSLTVIGVLTLGIGLNATVFTMLKGLALTPLAGVRDSAALEVVFAETGTGRDLGLSYPDYQYLRDHDQAFAGLFGSAVARVGLGRGKSARPVFAELVTGNYFQALGVRAALGRTLLPSDEVAAGRHPVVVLNDGLWRRDFGADPAIVGKTVELNNYPLTVVGVADPAFHGTIVSYDVEAFVPVMMGPDLGFRFSSKETTPSAIFADRGAAIFFAHGRLLPGVTRAAAAAQTDALWTTLARDRPIDEVTKHLRVVPFVQSPGTAPVQLLPTLVVLIAMGLLVLAIACANIAGLVLVRGVSRRGELAVRLALGATRTRIVRLLIVENLILTVPGAILGVVLARRGIPLMLGWADQLAAPDRLFFNIGVDRLVIAFAAVVGSGCALVFGLVPALQSSRIDLVSVINADASPRGAARGRLRAALVVAQVAVSLLLLIGAGLVKRSLDAAWRADPGFEREHVSALDVDVKQNGYDEAHGRAFYRQLLEAARTDRGIESATLALTNPLAFLDTRSQRLTVDGYQPRRGEDIAFMSNIVGPDYFRTLRIKMLAGREFSDRDDEKAAPAAIVNQTFARRFWGGAANAVGKRIKVAAGDWRTVIGVAADVKYIRINESPRPYFYLPFLQSYRSDMILYTRGPAPVEVLVDQAKARVTALDPELPIRAARSLFNSTRGALILFQLTATMLFLFGTAGMALAAMGTYGLISYIVKQSTHEIGIRLALGATGRSVVMAFLSRGLKLGAAGAALGVTAALALSRLLSGALYGVSATDPVSFAGALALVLSIVVVATSVPAWRASRTDPLSALRHQ